MHAPWPHSPYTCVFTCNLPTCTSLCWMISRLPSVCLLGPWEVWRFVNLTENVITSIYYSSKPSRKLRSREGCGGCKISLERLEGSSTWRGQRATTRWYVYEPWWQGKRQPLASCRPGTAREYYYRRCWGWGLPLLYSEKIRRPL